MIIREAVASFGKLENDSLELQDGLNIIYAPNEGGKSTWCSFIKAMLYGIDSSARKKAGVLPDKTKYAPWSGAPISGTLEITSDGRDITITRKGQGKIPMSDFSATLSGTADEIPALTESNIGEELTGVSRDVFERTAFIAQSKLETSNSSEIEKRISEVVQTGSEEVSYTESRERLKGAIRKRKYNRSGRIPEIDAEIEEIGKRLSAGTNELNKGDELRRARQNAVRYRDEIQNKVAESRKSSRRQTLNKMSAIRSNAEECEANYKKAKDNLNCAEQVFSTDIFDTIPPEECVNRLSNDERIVHEAEVSSNRGLPTTVIFALMLSFIVIGVVFVVTDHYLFGVLFWLGSIFMLVWGIIKIQIVKSNTSVINRTLRKYQCRTLAEVEELLEIHIENCDNYSMAVNDLKNAESSLEMAKQTEEYQKATLLKELDFVESDSNASKYTRLLEEAELELRTAREQLAAWEGRQSVSPNTQQLGERLSLLKAEREILTREYSALMLALETLDEARDDIRHRVTPRLSEKTATCFSQLTGSRYDVVALDKELGATARLIGESVSREQSYLSVGTTDQLYLALRLAMCDLLLPQENPCPIILDDALVNFDDERCKRAINLLSLLSENRQVILFTCHRREIEFAEDHANTHIKVMQTC